MSGNYVGTTVYWTYIRAGHVPWFIVMIFFLICYAGASALPTLWIGFWTSLRFGTNNSFYVGIFWLFALVGVISYVTASLCNTFHGAEASLTFHTRFLANIAHAQIAFFDATPMGRILNRFSKDLSLIDLSIPFFFSQYINSNLSMLAQGAVIAYSFPWLLLALVPLALLLIIYLRFYRKTSVRLQRIENVTFSPIVTHFSATLPGIASVRAYGQEEKEALRSSRFVEANSVVLFSLRMCDVWLQQRQDAMAAMLMLIVSFVMVGLKNQVSTSVAGTTITTVLAISQLLKRLSQNLIQLEVSMNAVERVHEFSTSIPLEAAAVTPNDPTGEWPTHGAIEFQNVSFRYRSELPDVLHEVSFSVKGGEKVGIVGRTGAGKSSLLTILLRMVELSGGRILIDGVDISKIGLHVLRSRLCIIPQDPILFEGSVRRNLDPFGEFGDASVWEALELTGMAEAVTKLGGIEAKVAEGGTNWSLGQRQLICIARAILRRPKILLLDEATASVDMESDALIQKTVRTMFRHSTVLTIAHRLHTVADSNQVLVLDKGVAVEMDRPATLMKKTERSYFRDLIQATGEASSKHLTHIIETTQPGEQAEETAEEIFSELDRQFVMSSHTISPKQ